MDRFPNFDKIYSHLPKKKEPNILYSSFLYLFITIYALDKIKIYDYDFEKKIE